MATILSVGDFPMGPTLALGCRFPLHANNCDGVLLFPETAPRTDLGYRMYFQSVSLDFGSGFEQLQDVVVAGYEIFFTRVLGAGYRQYYSGVGRPISYKMNWPNLPGGTVPGNEFWVMLNGSFVELKCISGTDDPDPLQWTTSMPYLWSAGPGYLLRTGGWMTLPRALRFC